MLFTFLGSELQHILNDSSVEVDSSSSDFWVLVAALKVGASHITSRPTLIQIHFSASWYS
jgi:5-enolpyruvylshikimate-3-phosphate synthase